MFAFAEGYQLNWLGLLLGWLFDTPRILLTLQPHYHYANPIAVVVGSEEFSSFHSSFLPFINNNQPEIIIVEDLLMTTSLNANFLN